MEVKSNGISTVDSNKPVLVNSEIAFKRAQRQNQLPDMNLFTTTIQNEATIYSIDAMHAYVNIFKPKVVINTIQKNVLEDVLSRNVWTFYNKKKEREDVSPMDVIKNPNNPLFSGHMEGIILANTAYPIYLQDSNTFELMDGYHRLAQKYMNNDFNISYIVFSKTLIKKFIFMDKVNPELPVVGTFEAVIVDFFDRFCKEKKGNKSLTNSKKK